jgi:BirA family biotin operon repressor/biotin-[acetyl-CoA-carboxylase] ligase
LYKIPANTLFIGKNLVFVPDCHSTNTLALQLSQQPTATDGTVVITDHQTAGKGQRGNVWEAEPSMNLTFSLILKPKFLAVNKQFYLNIVICLALRDYLKERTPDPIHIKWPNDILVHEKKISGVLIENQLQGNEIINAIAGVGLNINQRSFEAPRATSLANLTGRAFNLDAELGALLGFIESRYLQLRQDKYEMLMNSYLESLYRINARHTFSHDGTTFEGVIRNLDESGKLRIQTEGGIRSFTVKEIAYV